MFSPVRKERRLRSGFVLQWAMRPTAGTVTFFTASLVVLLIAAGAATGLIVLLATPGLTDALRALPNNTWWFIYSGPGDSAAGPFAGALASAPWRIGAAIVASILSLLAVLRARVIYRRVPSPIIPFLMMFLIALGLECLRAGTALLVATDSPISFSVLLTRVIYWGRFVGLLGVLLAGLYGLELKYTKIIVLGGLVLLVSFAMAAYIPVDRTVFLAQLTWKLGDEQSVWFLNLALAALAFLTGVVAALVRKGRRTTLLAAGIALFLIAREVEFFAVQPASLAAGLAAQVLGSLFSLRALSAAAK
jgi:hypothetical protein